MLTFPFVLSMNEVFFEDLISSLQFIRYSCLYGSTCQNDSSTTNLDIIEDTAYDIVYSILRVYIMSLLFHDQQWILFNLTANSTTTSLIFGN